MRHLLGTLFALTLVLAGCGGDDAGGSGDGSDDGSTVEPEQVVFVSESAVGGEVRSTATPVESSQAIREFAAQFDDARMGDRLAAEAAEIDVPDGAELAAAVVAVACDAPTDVSVERTSAGLQVTSPPVKTDKQCLVPVTTVALVTVPAG